MKIGDIVYHVAHPDVQGKITGLVQGPSYKPGSVWVPVEFETEIEFSGNSRAGKRMHWLCSSHLLFKTSEDARANHNPERARMYDRHQLWLDILSEVTSS